MLMLMLALSSEAASRQAAASRHCVCEEPEEHVSTEHRAAQPTGTGTGAATCKFLRSPSVRSFITSTPANDRLASRLSSRDAPVLACSRLLA